VLAAVPTVVIASENCDLENGRSVFQSCAVCHTNDDSGRHGAVGPNLNGVLNREVGSVSDYKFSSALKKSDEKWTPEHLHAFLESPMDVYPLTRMAFGGLKNDKDRRDVICMLGE